MKLARITFERIIHPVLVDDNQNCLSLKNVTDDISAAALAAGLIANIKKADKNTFTNLGVPAPESFLPCLNGIGKIIAIGKNYPEHAKEVGTKTPTEPMIFMKATSALTSAFAPIIRPRNSDKLDWEVELAVIIGKTGNYIAEENAMDHIAGYCTANDISERGFQNDRAGQFTKGKSADSFCPLGPYFVTRDDVSNSHKLRLWTEVNGQMMQDGHTGDMTYKVPFLIHYLSQFMTLQTGDIILTGTPAGVGKGRTPPVYLQPNDHLRCGVEGLGEQKHSIVQA